MQGIIDYVSSHPLAIMAIAFLFLLVIYFVFKQLIKLALFLVLIALIVGGYYYFKDPEKMPENLRQTIRETRDKSEKMLETGKQTYDKTKDFYEKSKDFYEKSKDFSKDIYDKSKELTKGSSEFFNRKNDKPRD